MEEVKKKRISIKDIIYICTSTLLVAGLVTMVVLYNQKKQAEALKEYYDSKVAAYALENYNYSKGQIVFIGDSITDGYHLDKYYSDLDKATYNRGIGGDTTDGVAGRLQTSLYDIAPSKVVLMIGINDINVKVENSVILANYQRILDGIKTNLPDTMLYTMSILPMHDKVPGYINLDKNTQTIMTINSQIKVMSEERGYQYIDMFSNVADENNHMKKEYSEDGIHLIDAGFQVWTNLVKPYLI